MIAYMLFFILGWLNHSLGQKKWDGGGGDNQWMNVLNWSNDSLPSVNDSVLLDNSFVNSNYSVVLPDGIENIAVFSIRIQPALAFNIQLVVPASNTAVPALSISGQPGLRLELGAVFLNGSGASSGTVLAVTDSIIIMNGARFIQNTRTAHATYISKLSRMPGTERGVFEFNVPGAASYTISLAGRTYGDLELSAAAAGGTKTYLSNGSSPATIRGNLVIQQGASYALDFAGEIQIRNDLSVLGTLNLSSSTNSNPVKLSGNLFSAGLITESGTGLPALYLSGTSPQYIWQIGSFTNQISLRVDNAESVTLRTDLRIPYRLELLRGKLISTDTSMLIISNGASLMADSSLASCYVQGPVRKNGLINSNHFLFPVGKDGTQRWLALRNATGDFKVEFFKQSPLGLSAQMGPGVDHISSIEYWSVNTQPNSEATVELSFNDVNSGGVSDMSSLRVANLKNLIWEDAGNSGYTGSAGASGSVKSSQINWIDQQPIHFTLASSNNFSNPLPIKRVHLSAQEIGADTKLTWIVQAALNPVRAELLWSNDGNSFKSILSSTNIELDHTYSYKVSSSESTAGFYKVSVVWENGEKIESDLVAVRKPTHSSLLLSKVVILGGTAIAKIMSNRQGTATLSLYNNNGRLVKSYSRFLQKGYHDQIIEIGGLPVGLYFLLISDEKGNRSSLKIFKPY